MLNNSLLHIDNLTVQVHTHRGVAEPVHGFDLALQRGETLGLIGESGSGKTMAMLAVMGLLPRNAQAFGSVRFHGKELLALDAAGWRQVRGGQIGMVFQEPMTALNPLQRVGDQVAEGVRLHRGLDAAAAREQAMAWLDRVGIDRASERWRDYPHQFSGGQRQRIVLASALACQPEILIADEPTTALDSTVQAQMLRLLQDLVEAEGLALILISHDLALVAHHVQRLCVLYAGRVMEHGSSTALFDHAAHPYTRALLAARPKLGLPRGQRLTSIPGRMPDLYAPPPGCRFADRCPIVQEACRVAEPPEQVLPGDGQPAHCVRCLFPQEGSHG
ncbi:MAG: ABC transporter ATP-binding protein [Brachymonas sp.]|nr:ABC transporter ATP-binding protein [Brachymonas sp.]